MIAGSFSHALLGGAFIGASAALLLLTNGRIAGISGIASGLLGRINDESLARATFICGLVLGPVVYRAVAGTWPIIQVSGTPILLIVAGLLVGFGTRLGSGCTSGHGVCGLSRLSRRSLVAVAIFLTTAVLTVTAMRHGVL